MKLGKKKTDKTKPDNHLYKGLKLYRCTHRWRQIIPMGNSSRGDDFFRASLYVWYLQNWELCDDLVKNYVPHKRRGVILVVSCWIWCKDQHNPMALAGVIYRGSFD